MSWISLYISGAKKNKLITHDVAKITLKSDIITPFGGIFFILNLFDKLLSKVIDTVLPERGAHHGYRHSEILRSLMSIFFCGGSAWRT